MLFRSVAYGFSDSLGPLVSVNKGAGQWSRVRGFGGIAAITVALMGILCFALMTLFPRELVHFFLPNPTPALDVALEFMDISRYMFLFCGLNIVITAYFTGLLQSAASAVVALCRGLLFPAVCLVILPPMWGDAGIYAALPLAEALTLVVGVVLLWRVEKKRKKGEN